MTINADFKVPGLYPARAASAASRPDPATPVGGAVARAVDAVNQMLSPFARSLQVSQDAGSGETVVHVIDRSTNQVLRQIPPHEMLLIARALDRVQGQLIREKA